MKYFKILPKLMLASAIVLSITSCKRNIDEDVELDLDTTIIKVDAALEITLADIDNIADQAEILETVTKKTVDLNDLLTQCAVLTKDTVIGSTADTITITVDFGNVNCEGTDTRNRRGVIEVVSILDKSGLRKERKVKTNNYYFEENKINIERKLIYGGQNSQNQYYWAISGEATIHYTDGDSSTHIFSRSRTLTGGETTPSNWSDDKWEIEGQENGVRKDGKTYSNQTTEPLLLSGDCEYIQQGKVKYTVEGADDFKIDYGAGSGCDNKVDVISDDGRTKVITID